MPGSMLVVDDEKNIRGTIAMIHENAGWTVDTAQSGDEAITKLASHPYDIVYLDVMMPRRDGIDVLREIKERWPEQLVVILTGNASIERAVEATRLGAFDFLEKDCGKDKILLTSRNALERRALSAENQMLRERISGKREFLGTSRAAQEVLKQVVKVAPTHARVLILGESGTGKELIAQAIHDRSERSKAPFVKVNCAAIPEELIEAELFGSVKGAFTGAESRDGKFQAADKGTLFLDEIGDMSLRVQTKVLRALQEGEIQKVGSNATLAVDVRVIAATNKDLAQEVAEGRFREDLYFRLNVVPLDVPPLRERAEDIPLLAEAFVEQYCQENTLPSKTLDPDVVQLLRRYPWPGNVRELQNQVERLVIMSSGRTVRVMDLSSELRQGKSVVAVAREDAVADRTAHDGHERLDETARRVPPPATQTLQEAKKHLERELIQQALERNGWNVSRAAQDLGLERTNLHKKIKQLKLKRS